MSSGGRKKDNLKVLNVEESGEFRISETYHGLEQDGLRIFVDQTVGKVSSIKVYTSGNRGTNEQLVGEFTINGLSTEIFNAKIMSTVRVEVSSASPSTMTLVLKPSAVEAAVDTLAVQEDSDLKESALTIRHEELLCVLGKILTELEHNNVYFSTITNHKL